jgi:hypothetical protein
MTSFAWPDSCPTVMSSGGTVTYLNNAPPPKDEASQEWVKRATARGEPVTIVYREAVAAMLTGVDAKAVSDAKLAPETTDTAAPTTGTAKAKEEAVAAKLATVLPPAEYEKLLALQATVKVAEEKPAEGVKDV